MPGIDGVIGFGLTGTKDGPDWLGMGEGCEVGIVAVAATAGGRALPITMGVAILMTSGTRPVICRHYRASDVFKALCILVHKQLIA